MRRKLPQICDSLPVFLYRALVGALHEAPAIIVRGPFVNGTYSILHPADS